MRICRTEDSLRDAARILLEEECGCLLVRDGDEDDHVAGLLTDRDVWLAVYRHGKDLAALCVRDAMSSIRTNGFGLRDALRAARADAGEMHPLALLDEQGQMLAIVSLVPLDAWRGAVPSCEEGLE